jgi:hypothetical protein
MENIKAASKLQNLPKPSKTTQICCHVQICEIALPMTFCNAITWVTMVFVTEIFATTFNLVDILVATLDRFVQDCCGSVVVTQTSCELLDFEIFLLLVFYKLMGKMTFLLGLLGVNKSTLLLALADKLNSNLVVKESITPKLHKKSICTQNQSSCSWIINWGKGFQM